MKQAYGYIRVSRRGRIDGDGFTRQKKAITGHVRANGFEITHIYQKRGAPAP